MWLGMDFGDGRVLGVFCLFVGGEGFRIVCCFVWCVVFVYFWVVVFLVGFWGSG